MYQGVCGLSAVVVEPREPRLWHPVSHCISWCLGAPHLLSASHSSCCRASYRSIVMMSDSAALTYKSLFTILYDSHRPSTSLSRHYKQSRSWTSQNRATATTTSNIVSGWLARSKTQSHGWGRRCCISWSTPGVSTVYSMEINLGLSIERNTL
jgi:hypothetical protein